MLKTISFFFLLISFVLAQPGPLSIPRTVVSDTLLDFSGQAFSGTIIAKLNSSQYNFGASTSTTNGTFSLSLYPGTYVVHLQSSTFGIERIESWAVPQSDSPIGLSGVGSPSANIGGGVFSGSTLPATCTPGTNGTFILVGSGPTGTLYTCTAPNTWTLPPSSGDRKSVV